MSGKLLVIVMSGWDYFERARQGLRVARNLVRGRMVDELGVLFLGPGVLLLDITAKDYGTVERFLRELREHGVIVRACHGNLRVYGLEDKFDKSLVMADDAATVVAEHLARGFTIATF